MEADILKKTYSFNEFLHRNDKKIGLLTGVMLISSRYIVYAVDTQNEIDSLGLEIVGYIKMAGRWFFIAICIMECVKALLAKKPSDIPALIVKYGLAYGCFSLILWLFNEIDRMLGGLV